LSAPAGTVVKFVPGRKGATAQMGTLSEAFEGGSLGGLVGFVFGNSCSVDETFVQSQSDVALHDILLRPTLFTC
jgi:hypothetical protein